MTRRRRLTSLLALIAVLIALLPAASFADDPAPPTRAWADRRHPETALRFLATQPPATAAAAPELFPYESWTAIAFQTYAYGNWDIALARPDGSHWARFTDHPKLDLRPRLDPNARRVAWVSDRDGNYEIYAANVDGSDLRRLTDNIWEDDEPVWSPDGTRIAFSSRRDGDYDVYVMDADGGNLRQLTDLPGDDFNPAWSPDGAQIAFIRATGQTTGEILTVPAAGGAAEPFAGPFVYPARLVWSPDGRSILFDALVDRSGWTRVVTVERGGEPRILYAPDDSDGWMNAFSPDGSQIIATQVFWVVYGGEYYLSALMLRRVRIDNGAVIHIDGSGTDAMADWQSLDRTPPQSTLVPLPAFSRDQVTVAWRATDGAGVGVQKVEFRLDDLTTGEWAGAMVEVPPLNHFTVDGKPGHTYRYHIRAIDGAGNAEAWNDAYSETTFYGWQISGTAGNARGAPVRGAVARANAEPLREFPSASTGAYRTYLATLPDKVDVSWQRDGFLPLPPTQFDKGLDASLDVALASADNVVANPGFEDGNLAGWTLAGDVPPVATGDHHTGRGGALLGPGPAGDASRPLFAWPHGMAALASASDAAGRFYIALGGTGDAETPLYLVTVQPDGVTYDIHLVDGATGSNPALAVSANGAVDLTWFSGNALYHRHLDARGAWSAPTLVRTVGNSRLVALAVDAQGALHLLTDAWPGATDEVVYRKRDASGAWSDPVSLGPARDWLNTLDIGLDGQGRVHALWARTQSWVTDADEVIYRVREANGVWSEPVTLESGGDLYPQATLAVGADGVARVLWRPHRDQAGSLNYAARALDGTWQRATLDSTATAGPAAAADEQGVIHAAWGRADGVAYAHLAPLGGEKPSMTVLPAANVSRVRVVGHGGAAYVGWFSRQGQDSGIAYWGQAQQSGWGAARPLGYLDRWSHFQMAALPSGRPALGWIDAASTARYLIPPAAGQESESRLSQRVTIPAGMTGATLSLMLRVDKAWADPRGGVELRLRDATGKVTLLSRSIDDMAGWRHAWHNLSPWQGQTVTVEIAAVTEPGGPPVRAYVDEVTVSSGLAADTWVEPSLGGIPAGKTGALTLLYGNRGDFDAADATLRLSLPAGVTLIGANPPAQPDGGAFVWHLGALPAGATGSVEVTLRNDAASGNPGPLTVTITPGPGEIYMEDNDVSAMVWGPMRVLLPRVAR